MITAIIVIFAILTLLSVPIAFSIGLAVAAGIAFFSGHPMIIMFQRMVTGLDNFVLVAIPLFILTGSIMNASGITDRIFTLMRRLIGHISGGLAHANVGASMVFAGMSGSAVADAGGLGAIEIKAMRDQGYKPEFAAAVTAASSTVGPIIPPSIPFILYGALAEVSVGRLFVAGFFPGIMLGFSMVLMIAFLGWWRYDFPRDERSSFRQIARSFVDAFLALMAPVIILVGLLGGIFTPTEAGAIAVAYSLLLGLVIYRTISLRDMPRIMIEAMVTTAIVTFIISNVTAFSWVLVMEQAGRVFVDIVTSLTADPIIILLLINVALLIMGALIEAGAVLLLMTPILLPLVLELGIDPVHFGVIIVLNLMIGVATPPIGMSLFVTAHVAKVPIERVMWAILPLLIPLFATLLLVTYWPDLSLYLPALVFG